MLDSLRTSGPSLIVGTVPLELSAMYLPIGRIPGSGSAWGDLNDSCKSIWLCTEILLRKLWRLSSM